LSNNIQPNQPNQPSQPNQAKLQEKTNAMSVLGVLTSVCECKPTQGEKERCHGIIEPLEKGTKNAIDVMTEMILDVGPDEFNKTVENLDQIIAAATQQAKTRLIELGQLDKDGNPIG